ncbi:MAG: organic radical activating enzyme, partial [Rickettsiales bacterium]
DKKKNEKNRKLVLQLAAKNGCRISLQTHKLWEID